MINLKSLKRLTEADDPVDIRHKADLEKADADYDKSVGSTLLPRGFKYHLPWGKTNKEIGSAGYDRDAAIDAADARHKAGHKGLVTQQDHNDVKFEAAKAKNTLVNKAKDVASKTTESASTEDKPGIIRRIGGAVADNPWVAGATVAGLAGLAAMQKRKSRLPEPGSYNQGV